MLSPSFIWLIYALFLDPWFLIDNFFKLVLTFLCALILKLESFDWSTSGSFSRVLMVFLSALATSSRVLRDD